MTLMTSRRKESHYQTTRNCGGKNKTSYGHVILQERKTKWILTDPFGITKTVKFRHFILSLPFSTLVFYCKIMKTHDRGVVWTEWLSTMNQTQFEVLHTNYRSIRASRLSTDQVGLSNNNPHWNLGFRFLFFLIKEHRWQVLCPTVIDHVVCHPNSE